MALAGHPVPEAVARVGAPPVPQVPAVGAGAVVQVAAVVQEDRGNPNFYYGLLHST